MELNNLSEEEAVEHIKKSTYVADREGSTFEFYTEPTTQLEFPDNKTRTVVVLGILVAGWSTFDRT